MSSATIKVSDVTIQDVANYLRIAELTESEQAFIGQILEAAKAYVMKYTGLDLDGLDGAPDLVIAVYVLCADMYDNRSLYVEGGNVSQAVETILSMHSVNLLPTE